MGFAQWFWRLFLVFSGIIVAHVLIVSLLVSVQGVVVQTSRLS